MSSYIKGNEGDFYSLGDLGVEDDSVNYNDEEISQLEWNYLYKYIVAYNGVCSQNNITGIVVANDEYSARDKIFKKYSKYENCEIRLLEKTDIIELERR